MLSMSEKRKYSRLEDPDGHQSKKFIPETTLEVGDQEVNFDFFAKNIKIEAADTYENDSSNELADGFISGLPDSPDDQNFDVNSETNDENIIVLHMDIRDPLYTIRALLEEEIGGKFDDFSFSLQDSQLLEDHKNLVDQCVQGEGRVQINVELKNDERGKRINIVDVLKPTEEELVIGEGERDNDEDEDEEEDDDALAGNGNMVRWKVDTAFKKDQERLNIPQDPEKWEASHVRHWLMWAVRQFNLSGIQLSQWLLNGQDLAKMTHDEFRTKVPRDPQNTFWTHFELLRKCKIVAITPKQSPHIKQEVLDEDEIEDEGEQLRKEVLQKNKAPEKVRMVKAGRNYPIIGIRNEMNDEEYQPSTVGGPVQLWQFLLELLTDKNHRNAIQWLENEGEFKLINPELVAHLWGLRKNKPTMNYEKLSRALRYYYDGDMISKVHGKRFVYKFVCDLKQMLGYSASELNALVIEAELKAKHKNKVNQGTDPYGLLDTSDIITIYHPSD
ncbi:DNA-binding protein Ets97D isoform X2 [Halyomorpha halys]|uniref:DNA-binding protein Ets97D isoform X2 n=1 Tax=Halyomorpha halys TaxID=286706 RepID=UPI0006D4C932|nr:DNA-binding protein Ets97D [Halyomorpha halys]